MRIIRCASGKRGKVGRSSRATIVNETFGLWLASGSGGGYRVSFCSDRRPFPRDGGDHVWSGVAQPASRRCPGTHDYGTRSSMDSRLLRRIRGTLLCLAASAPCVWHDHDLEHVAGEPSEAKFELVKVCWRRMAGRRRSFAILCESPWRCTVWLWDAAPTSKRTRASRGSSKRRCHRAGGPGKTRGRREGEVAVLGRRRRSGAEGSAGSASFPCSATVSPRESTHSVNSLAASRAVSLGSFGSGEAEQNGDRHLQDASQGQERATECTTLDP